MIYIYICDMHISYNIYMLLYMHVYIYIYIYIYTYKYNIHNTYNIDIHLKTRIFRYPLAQIFGKGRRFIGSISVIRYPLSSTFYPLGRC